MLQVPRINIPGRLVDVNSKELACANVGKPQIGLHVLLIKELGRKAPQKTKNASKRPAQRRESVILLRKSVYLR
jgi:hypothetical protein